jgi:hypothetical protein
VAASGHRGRHLRRDNDRRRRRQQQSQLDGGKDEWPDEDADEEDEEEEELDGGASGFTPLDRMDSGLEPLFRAFPDTYSTFLRLIILQNFA